MSRRTSFFDEFSNILRSFDNLFRQSVGEPFSEFGRPLLTAGEVGVLPASAAAGPTWWPAVETLTRKDELVIRAELPGVDADHLELSMENDRLVLRGEKREEHRSEDENLYLRELSYGRFERSFALPEGVKPEQIKARFRNGVLEVVLPARGIVSTSRRIAIESGKEGKKHEAA